MHNHLFDLICVKADIESIQLTQVFRIQSHHFRNTWANSTRSNRIRTEPYKHSLCAYVAPLPFSFWMQRLWERRINTQNKNFTWLGTESQPMFNCKDSMMKLYKFRRHALRIKLTYVWKEWTVSCLSLFFLFCIYYISISKILFYIQIDFNSIRNSPRCHEPFFLP